jgi:hypothetical protein
MKVLEIVAVVAIVMYVIARQALGEPIRAKRFIILPGVLILIGVVDLAKHTVHPSSSDIVLIAIGAAIAVGIGLVQGHVMRLEQRDGTLWGQLPRQGLWLWVALYASRGALIGIAHATGAHVAAGVQSELLILGVNRLGQAAIVAWRAQAAGIPFTPEKSRLGVAAPTRVPQAMTSSEDVPPGTPPPAQQQGPAPATAGARWTSLIRQIGVAASGAADSRMQHQFSGPRDRRQARRSRHRW